MSSYIKTIADTIIYVARERLDKGQHYQNENSAIHAVNLEVQLELVKTMKENGK